ncbi:hypothetical protein HAL1_18736 [Halomonas sp. HAL1]|nr:hypothetical protein HAL1_18736 [Halomonas sp. HAL1]
MVGSGGKKVANKGETDKEAQYSGLSVAVNRAA